MSEVNHETQLIRLALAGNYGSRAEFDATNIIVSDTKLRVDLPGNLHLLVARSSLDGFVAVREELDRKNLSLADANWSHLAEVFTNQ